MFKPILRGKVHVILTSELWSVVCVGDMWDAKPGEMSFGFVND